MAKDATPNPGSHEAIDRGCICAVLDNGHGKGAFDGIPDTFWITGGCPIHDPQEKILKPSKRNDIMKGIPITVRAGKQTKPKTWDDVEVECFNYRKGTQSSKMSVKIGKNGCRSDCECTECPMLGFYHRR